MLYALIKGHVTWFCTSPWSNFYNILVKNLCVARFYHNLIKYIFYLKNNNKINNYYKEMNNEFLIAMPHGPWMHQKLSYCWATASYVSEFVSLFVISANGEAKSKHVHGAILFLGIQ